MDLCVGAEAHESRVMGLCVGAEAGGLTRYGLA